MNTRIYFLAFCTAVLSLTACNNFSDANVIDVPTNEYAIDIDHFVNQNFFDVAGTPTINIAANSPFTATILKTDNLNVDYAGRDRGCFVLTPSPIPSCRIQGKDVQVTRDITVYLRPFDLQRIDGFDFFNYPVRIRQRGTDGTHYLSAEEVAAWKEDHKSQDWDGGSDQRYVLGIVKRVGAIHDEEGVQDPDSYVGPLWKVPATQQSFGSPQSLEAIDMLLDINGTELHVKIHYFKAYKLVSNLQLSVGNTVEMNIPASGIIAGDDALWVSPLDILVR